MGDSISANDHTVNKANTQNRLDKQRFFSYSLARPFMGISNRPSAVLIFDYDILKNLARVTHGYVLLFLFFARD